MDFLTGVTLGYLVLIVICAFIVAIVGWYLWTNQ